MSCRARRRVGSILCGLWPLWSSLTAGTSAQEDFIHVKILKAEPIPPDFTYTALPALYTLYFCGFLKTFRYKENPHYCKRHFEGIGCKVQQRRYSMYISICVFSHTKRKLFSYRLPQIPTFEIFSFFWGVGFPKFYQGFLGLSVYVFTVF